MATLHQSGLATLRDCEQRFAYRYEHGVESKYLSAPLVLGSWFHAVTAAEMIVEGEAQGTRVLPLPEVLDVPGGCSIRITSDAPTAEFTIPNHRIAAGGDFLSGEFVVKAARLWWKAGADGGLLEDFDKRYGKGLPEILLNLLQRYRVKWGEEDSQHVEVLGVEVPWRRDIVLTDGSTVSLAGRVDSIVRDHRFGLVVVRDLKTHQSWPSEPQFVQDLLNSQLHLYGWGVAPLLEEHDIPAPGALEWDRVRTKPPSTPVLTKGGNLSKSVTDFDAYTYWNWADAKDRFGDPAPHRHYPGTKKDGSGAGVYWPEDGVVDRLVKAEDEGLFFRRRRFPVNEAAALAHLRMAVDDAPRVKALKEGARPVRSPGRSCSWCDYLMLCKAQMFGETPEGPGQYLPDNYNLKAIA